MKARVSDTNVFGFLGAFGSRARFRFIVFTGARAALGALDLVAFGLVGLVLAGSFELPGPLGTTLGLGQGGIDTASLTTLIGFGAIASLFVFKSISSVAIAWRLNFLLAETAGRLATDLCRDLLARSPKQIQSRSMSELTWLLQVSASSAFQSIPFIYSSIVADLTLTILIFGFLMYLDWSATLILAFYLGLIVFVYQLLVRRSASNAGMSYGEAYEKTQDVLGVLATAFRELYVTGNAERFVSKFSVERRISARALAVSQFVSTLPRGLLEVALFAGLFMFVAFYYGVAGGQMDLSSVAIFALAGIRLMAALVPMQGNLVAFRIETEKARAAIEAHANVDNSTAVKSLPALAEGTTTARSPVGVELSEVRFAYEDGRKITLTVSSLVVTPSQYVAVVGPSGGGKSTLLDLVIGVIEPSTGSVLIEGVPAQTFVRENPGRIGYVPQKPGFFRGTVLENLVLGSTSRSSREDAFEALAEAGLDQFVRQLPQGLDTDIGKHAEGMSGGQLQRLALARALMSRPSLLILDEATSSLDLRTEADILNSIATLSYAPTRIVVAHRLSSITNADLVFVINDGQIESQGLFKDLATSSPTLSALLKSSRHGEPDPQS